jgi:hypothetical protein
MTRGDSWLWLAFIWAHHGEAAYKYFSEVSVDHDSGMVPCTLVLLKDLQRQVGGGA